MNAIFWVGKMTFRNLRNTALVKMNRTIRKLFLDECMFIVTKLQLRMGQLNYQSFISQHTCT